MTNDSDSFVQEVNESLRQDRVVGFLRQNGIYIGIALVIFIGGIAGWQIYKDQTLKGSRAHAQEYAAAQRLAQEGNLADAKTEYERLSGEGPRVYRAMAQMEHAAVLETEGDLEGALAGFDRAAETATDPLMRDTARLRAAYLAAETGDFAALRTRLEPLIASDTRISYLARELLAIEAWEAGETDLARTTLEQLQLSLEAPEAVQSRATTALAVIGPAPQSSQSEGAANAPAPSEGETK